MKPIKLIMLPFAGGSANYYLKWKADCTGRVEIVPIDIPGRALRMKEMPVTSVAEAVLDIIGQLEIRGILSGDYAVFGHSMGSLLAFEMMHILRARGLKMPICAFLSGYNPPGMISEHQRHLMNDNQLIREIANLGGIPQEVLDNQELMKFFLPTFRADFHIVDTYRYEKDRELLSIPLIILGGIEDELAEVSDLIHWRDYTASDCSVIPFSGGHFYIMNNGEMIVKIIENHLSVQIGHGVPPTSNMSDQ